MENKLWHYISDGDRPAENELCLLEFDGIGKGIFALGYYNEDEDEERIFTVRSLTYGIADVRRYVVVHDIP